MFQHVPTYHSPSEQSISHTVQSFTNTLGIGSIESFKNNLINRLIKTWAKGLRVCLISVCRTGRDVRRVSEGLWRNWESLNVNSLNRSRITRRSFTLNRWDARYMTVFISKHASNIFLHLKSRFKKRYSSFKGIINNIKKKHWHYCVLICFTQDLESMFDGWKEDLTHLMVLRESLSSYITSEDLCVLQERIELLHRQWEEICHQVHHKHLSSDTHMTVSAGDTL